MTYKGGPPVYECVAFPDEGEIGGVGEAVRLCASFHLCLVEGTQGFPLVGVEFRKGREGGDSGVE